MLTTRFPNPPSLPASHVSKDTLTRRVPDVLSGCCSRVHLLSAGELAHQLGLEILPPLVLLATVDEHFVLQGMRRDCLGRWCWGRSCVFVAIGTKTQQPPGFGTGVSVFWALTSSKAKHHFDQGLESSTDSPEILDSKIYYSETITVVLHQPIISLFPQSFQGNFGL